MPDVITRAGLKRQPGDGSNYLPIHKSVWFPTSASHDKQTRAAVRTRPRRVQVQDARFIRLRNTNKLIDTLDPFSRHILIRRLRSETTIWGLERKLLP